MASDTTLIPRLFMSLQLQDTAPIIDILSHRPPFQKIVNGSSLNEMMRN